MSPQQCSYEKGRGLRTNSFTCGMQATDDQSKSARSPQLFGSSADASNDRGSPGSLETMARRGRCVAFLPCTTRVPDRSGGQPHRLLPARGVNRHAAATLTAFARDRCTGIRRLNGHANRSIATFASCIHSNNSMVYRSRRGPREEISAGRHLTLGPSRAGHTPLRTPIDRTRGSGRSVFCFTPRARGFRLEQCTQTVGLACDRPGARIVQALGAPCRRNVSWGWPISGPPTVFSNDDVAPIG